MAFNDTYYKQYLISEGPVAYWPLDENSGTTVVDAKSVQNGTYVGSPTLAQPGPSNPLQSVAFNGSSQYVTIPFNAAFDLSTFTMEAWVKWDGTTLVSGGVYGVFTNGSNVLELGQNPYTVWGVQTSGGGYSEFATANTWTHVVAVMPSSGSMSFYIDGNLISSGTISVTANSTDALLIGNDTLSNPGKFLPGSIAHVAIYNTALTATQVANHYAVGTNDVTVTAVSPSSGPHFGGTTVTLTGTGFTTPGFTSVAKVGGVSATGVSVANDTTMSLVVPSLGTGSVGSSEVVDVGSGSIASPTEFVSGINTYESTTGTLAKSLTHTVSVTPHLSRTVPEHSGSTSVGTSASLSATKVPVRTYPQNATVQTSAGLELVYKNTGSQYTPQTLFGAELMENMGPWLNMDLAKYCDAIGAEFEQVMEIVQQIGGDGDPDYQPPYGSITNPTTCPDAWVPWLGMFAGQPIPVGASTTQARNLLLTTPNRSRGNTGSVTDAIVQNLVGSQFYHINRRTRPSGTPDSQWFTLTLRPEQLLWNLVANPSFEHDTVGSAPAAWTAIGSSVLTVDTSWSASGSNSLLITGSGTIGATTSAISIMGAQTYTASVVTNSSVPITVTLTWSDSTTVSVSDTGTVSVTGLAPSAATTVTVSASSTGSYNIDSVIVQESATTPAYIDGDSLPYAWSGTAGDSTTTALPKLLSDVDTVKPAGLVWPSSMAEYNLYTALGCNPITLTDLETWLEATKIWSAEGTLTWIGAATTAA